MNMQSLSSLFSHSPSFNSYSSSDKLTQIADRVVNEFQSDDDDKFQSDVDEQLVVVNNNQGDRDDDDDDDGEFEFNLAPLSPIPADEIFSNGQIRPVYPLFNTDLVFGNGVQVGDNSIASCAVPKASQSARLPLGKLFDEERDRDNFTSSCSSSESDELDGVPAETYCVWAPTDNSREICKKSSSTGTSKRWKLRNLLQKSNSDGKDTFSFLKSDGEATKIDRKDTAPPPLQQYLKKGPAKENNRNRSFLPYKKDLVELFFRVKYQVAHWLHQIVSLRSLIAKRYHLHHLFSE